MAREKLVDIVQEQLKKMIENKEYNEHGFLPSEGDLAIKFSVSRVTVREAVKSMEIRGFVKRIHGKGVQVVEEGVDVLKRTIEDLIFQGDDVMENLFEVRSILEPKCAELSALKFTEEDLEKLEGYVEYMEKAKTMDEKYYEADLDFHLTLAEICGNKIIYAFIKAYTPIFMELIIQSSKAIVPIEQRCHYHRNVLEAVRTGDPRLASKEMEKHIAAGINNRVAK